VTAYTTGRDAGSRAFNLRQFKATGTWHARKSVKTHVEPNLVGADGKNDLPHGTRHCGLPD